MTVSELARNAGFPGNRVRQACLSRVRFERFQRIAAPSPSRSDYRYGIKYKSIRAIYQATLHPQTRRRAERRRRSSSSPGAPTGPSRQAKLDRNRFADIGEACPRSNRTRRRIGPKGEDRNALARMIEP